MNSPARSKTEAYQTAVDFLYDRINYERTADHPYNQNNFRLSRMERLLVELGNPQQAAPVVHVAGSKGKGSVAWLTAECLRRSGYRTGLYTSPHLLKLEERFVLNGQPIDDSQLVEAVDAVRPAARQIEEQGHGHATFFELTTSIAWWLFKHYHADVNVIEVGLGGRLDCTNVCWPALSIITSISLDHQQQLGHTIAEIASEKAGIIKPGVPVVSGATHPDATHVIARVAKERGCKLRQLDVDFSAIENKCDPAGSGDGKLKLNFQPSAKLWPNGYARSDLELRMAGRHQLANASVVVAGLDILREHAWKISEEAIRSALASTQVPGRIEIVADLPTTIIDTAHNDASIQALIETLESRYSHKKRRIAIFSASRDKNCVEMLELLIDAFDEIILTQFQCNPRAQSAEILLSMAEDIYSKNASDRSSHPKNRPGRIRVVKDSQAALETARQLANPNDLIVATGSFFLATELLPLFRFPI